MRPRVRYTLRLTGQPGEGLSLAQAHTALYGWLYARHEGGAFLLRIEGDRAPGGTRNAQQTFGAEKPLAQELRWLGLDWDGGPEAPDPRSLARSRVEDGDKPLAGGRPDPLRARVLDDHEMAITHVFCGAGRPSLAERELALHQALGWEPPRYVHLPAIEWPEATSPAGEGMPEHPTIAAYRARGYLPLALANHLARLGWAPRGKRELLPLAELTARFDLSATSARSRPARRAVSFDLRQLNWFNRRALRALDVREVTALLVPRWQAAYGAADRAAGTALSPDEWQQALALALRDELDHLDQVAVRARFALVDEVTPDEEARAALAQPYAAEVFRAFVRELPTVEPFTYEPIDAWISALRQRLKTALGPTHGVRSRDVMYVLRAALTGRLDGPCLVEVCQLLGPERCARRIRAQMGRGVQ